MHMKPNDALIKNKTEYMAYKKTDKTTYKGLLGKNYDDRIKIGDLNKNEEVINYKIKFDNDVKVASPKRARNTFANLYKNNEEFRNAVDQSQKEMTSVRWYGDKLAKTYGYVNNKKGKMSDIALKTKGYDAFNVNLVNKSESGKKAANIFYDSLKKQGINAVQDINDHKYSGYNSKNPIIVFGGSRNYAKNILNTTEINDNLQKTNKRLSSIKNAKEFGKVAGKTSGIITSAIGIKNVINKKAINNYKLQHPNTKMSDKEILKILVNKQ